MTFWNGAPSLTATERKLRLLYPVASCADQSVGQIPERAFDAALLFVDNAAATGLSDKSTAILLNSLWYRWKLRMFKETLTETRRVERITIKIYLQWLGEKLFTLLTVVSIYCRSKTAGILVSRLQFKRFQYDQIISCSAL